MSARISVVEVENTEEQLKFMPLKGSIMLKMAGNINPLQLKKYIRILRLSHEEGIYPYPKSFSDLHTGTDMSYVDFELEMHGETLHISPADTFTENTKYVLYISARAHSIRNTITIDDTEVSSISTNEVLPYTIEISVLSDVIKSSSGKDVFMADIKRTGRTTIGSVLIDVGGGTLFEDYTITVSDPSIIKDGSIIKIKSQKDKPMGDDYILEFSTGMAVKLKELKPVDTSTKIKPEDIMNFYNNPGFMHVKGASISGKSSTISNGTDSWQGNVGNSSSVLSLTKPIEIRLPSKVFIHLDEPVTKDQISASGLAVDIYEAFDNYHLSKMGLYCDTQNLIFEFSIQRSGKVLQIEVIDDTDNIVPDGERWIARWKK